MDLQEILQQPDGFTPPEVTVKIDKVYERKSGEGEHGPWSFQTLQLAGGGRLKLKNVDAVGNDKAGQTVILKANHSKQHGLTGLSVQHEQYRDKTFDQIVVTGSAKWEWQNGNGTTAPAKSNGNGHKPDTRVEYSAPQRYDAESFKTHLLGCADVAIELITALNLVDDQAKQACFATVCIDAQRHNVILGDSPASEPPQGNLMAERKEALMKGVRSACKLLNDEGYEPPFSPARLDQYVNEKFETTKGAAGLSFEQTEDLIQALSEKLDNFRLNKSVGDDQSDDDVPF